jgi:hypothetical protein
MPQSRIVGIEAPINIPERSESVREKDQTRPAAGVAIARTFTLGAIRVLLIKKGEKEVHLQRSL